MSRFDSMRHRLTAQIDGRNWAAEQIADVPGDVLNRVWEMAVPTTTCASCWRTTSWASAWPRTTPRKADRSAP